MSSGIRNLRVVVRPVAIAGALAALSALVGCPALQPWWTEEFGECSSPQPGIVLDKLRLEKSVWADLPSTFHQDWLGSTLCRMDLRSAPGDEILFSGAERLAVLPIQPNPPDVPPVTELMVWPGLLVFIDLDGDGDLESMTPNGTSLGVYDDDGTPLLVRHTIVHGVELHDYTWGDLEGDELVEFVVLSEIGMEIIGFDGEPISEVRQPQLRGVDLADLDADGILEIVTVDTDFRIVVRNTRGIELSSFTAPPEHHDAYEPGVVMIDRLSDDDPRDYLRLGCELYDAEGVKVGERPDDDGNCYRLPAIDYGSQLVQEACPDGTEADVTVRLYADQPAYRVEAEYTYQYTLTFPPIGCFQGPGNVRATLRIYDGGDRLVYEEVIRTRSSSRSVLVVDSDVEGEEILLVADDDRILSYRRGE